MDDWRHIRASRSIRNYFTSIFRLADILAAIWADIGLLFFLHSALGLLPAGPDTPIDWFRFSGGTYAGLLALLASMRAFLARRSAADSSASANFLKMDFFLMVAMVLISSSSGIEPKRFNSRSRREVIPPAIARWQEPYVGGGRKTRPEMGGDKYSPETKYLL